MALNKFNYENISKEVIKDIFEAAFIPFGEDEDGDIFTKDEQKTYIKISTNKRRISFFCIFKGSDIDTQEKHGIANKINMESYFAKVMIMDSGNVRLDYDIDLTCDISTMFFISTLRTFTSRVARIVRSEKYGALFS